MPYIIPSSSVTPGTVYQPGKGIPGYIKANARAMACIKGGALSPTHMLDQSPRNNGTRRTGEQGRCYNFDGIDDIVISNYQDLNLKGDLVLACRFNWDNGSASDKFLISFAAGGEAENANVQYSIFLQASSGNELQYFHEYGSGTNEIISFGWTPDPDVNYNLVVTRDSVNKIITAYIDGSEVGSNTYTNDPTGGSSAVFGIGGLNGASVPFSGKIWDVRIGDSIWGVDKINNYSSFGEFEEIGPVLGWWKCDEQSGTVAYDSSGNGYHGTITNATLSTFHATQDIWSFQNLVGYNLSGSVYIPRDESDPSNDVLGNPLTYTGRRPNDFKLTGSNCVDLNGTDQIVTVTDNSAFDWSTQLTGCIWAKNSSANLSSFQALFGKYDISADNREFRFGINNTNKIFFQYVNANGTFRGTLESNDAVISDNVNLYSFVFNSGSLKLFLNGREISASVTSGPAPLSTIPNKSSDFTIGCSLNGSAAFDFWDGQLFDLKLYDRAISDAEMLSLYQDTKSLIDDANLIGRWKCQEGAGTICYDSSGNENHGTIENAASNWGVNQDLVHSNLLEGHSIYEHATNDPIRVPFGSNGQPLSITPPAGYSKTSDNYAGDYHNDAETTVDFDPDSTPEMGATQLGITVPSAHAFGAAFTASDQIFSRQRTKTEDRFLVFTEAQTGSALTNIQKYTQP